MGTVRWQDGVNLMLGVWLFISPWLLGYAGSSAAWNAYALGAGLAAFAALAVYMPKAWEEAVNTALGIWLVVAPFALGFEAMPRVSLHTVLVGIMVTALAIWAMFDDRAFYKRWHSGPSV